MNAGCSGGSQWWTCFATSSHVQSSLQLCPAQSGEQTASSRHARARAHTLAHTDSRQHMHAHHRTDAAPPSVQTPSLQDMCDTNSYARIIDGDPIMAADARNCAVVLSVDGFTPV